jgi:hypothetical protein
VAKPPEGPASSRERKIFSMESGMNHSTGNGRRALLLTLAVAITAWGVLGFFDRQQRGRAEFVYDTEYIVMVMPDGPAAAAGMQDGDRLVSVEGIPVEDLPLYSRWPRSLSARVGESRRFVVERDGEQLTIDVAYSATPRGVRHLQLGGALIGLSFLWLGIWALLAVGTRPAVTLAYIGVAAGVAAFGHGPYLGTWDGVATHITTAALVLWIVLLLRFFLTFPRRTRAGESRLATRIIYGAWVLVLPLLVLELIFHPVLYHTFGPLIGLLTLVYCILTLAAVTSALAKTPRRELWESGMGWILAGLVLAVVPTLVGLVDWALLLEFHIPGSSYYPLLLAVVPLTMALAVRQQAQAGADS